MGGSGVDALDLTIAAGHDDRFIHARENAVDVITRMRCRAQLVAHIIKNGGQFAKFVTAAGRKRFTEIRIAKFLGLRLQLANSIRLFENEYPHYDAAQQQHCNRPTADPQIADAATFVFLGLYLLGKVHQVRLQVGQRKCTGNEHLLVPPDCLGRVVDLRITAVHP